MFLKTNFLNRNWLIVLLLLSINACKKENTDGTKSIGLDKAEYYPMELAELNTENLPISEPEYMANINGTAFKVTNINGSLLFAMPDMAPGNYTLTVLIADKEYSAGCTIKDLPAVADPDAVLQNNQNAAHTRTTQLLSLADSLNSPAVNACKADLLAMQQYMDSLHNLYAALSPSDKLACARFLTANAVWMEEVHQSIEEVLAAGASFKTTDAIDDYEAKLDAAIVKFTAARVNLAQHVKRIILLSAAGFGIGSVVPVIGNALGAKLGASIGVGLLLLDVKAALQAQDDLLNTSFSPYQNLIAEKTAAVVPFNKGQDQLMEVRMSYRSLYSADKNSTAPAISSFVTDCDLIKSLWLDVTSYVPINFTFNGRTVDEISSFSTQTRFVNSKYISVDGISNSNVQLANISKTDGQLTLAFNNTATTTQSFTFNLNYQNSRFGSQSSVIDAEVNAGAPVSLLDSNLIGNWVCTAWQVKDYQGVYQDYLSRQSVYITSVNEVVCFDTTIHPTQICISTYTINDLSLSFSAVPSSVSGTYQATYNFSETDVECSTDNNGQWVPCDPFQLAPETTTVTHSNAYFTSNVQQMRFNIYAAPNTPSIISGNYVWQGQNEFKLTRSASEYQIFTRQ